MDRKFFTIPDAPDYEISTFHYIVRNKKTGAVLKLQKAKHGGVCYSMRRPDGRSYHRSPEFLLRVAKAAAVSNRYLPIPSLDNRYEINERGTVRNVRTKQVIKTKSNGKSICVQMGGKGQGHYHNRAIADLLWEVHGIIKTRRYRPCPCSCYRTSSLSPNSRLTFTNLKACARYIADKDGKSFRSVYVELMRRAAVIGDWKIIYGGD